LRERFQLLSWVFPFVDLGENKNHGSSIGRQKQILDLSVRNAKFYHRAAKTTANCRSDRHTKSYGTNARLAFARRA
jgi:hypothetical protein